MLDMEAEGLGELAAMLFFQSTLTDSIVCVCILQAVRNRMTMSMYLTRLHEGGESISQTINGRQTVLLNLSSG